MMRRTYPQTCGNKAKEKDPRGQSNSKEVETYLDVAQADAATV